jgi:hypothetical protein
MARSVMVLGVTRMVMGWGCAGAMYEGTGLPFSPACASAAARCSVNWTSA